MTGLHPAREFHTALFDISTDTIQMLLMACCLLLATFAAIMLFSAYILPIMLGAMIISMVVEFFSDLHKRNTWSDD